MKPIDEIEARLQAYPAVRYVVSTDSLRMNAPEARGFAIAIRRGANDGWDVTFGEGLHCHFPTAPEAAEFFAFGLSDRCRLREIYRGSVPYRAYVERREAAGWHIVQETGLLLYPFWRRPVERIFQNTLIRTESPHDQSDRHQESRSKESRAEKSH